MLLLTGQHQSTVCGVASPHGQTLEMLSEAGLVSLSPWRSARFASQLSLIHTWILYNLIHAKVVSFLSPHGEAPYLEQVS